MLVGLQASCDGAASIRSALDQPCVRARIFPTLGMHIQPWSSRERELVVLMWMDVFPISS